MEGMIKEQSQPQQQPPQSVAERLNPALVHELNLESLKTRVVSLFKAISRILEDFDSYARTNTTPKWQDILGQYSMVNLELYNIVDEITKVSKAFVVHPKNVNAENATVLPVMLSSKLLPEMETDDNSKREQLLQGMQTLPVQSQVEKLKARIDMIKAACESAKKVLDDTRKAYCFGTRQGPAILPTLDKGQAAKIQEQENMLRAAVNFGEGLRISAEQKQISTLPVHLADVLSVGDGMHTFGDTSGMYFKGTPPLSSNNVASQGTPIQSSGSQLMSRTAASPSAATSTSSFDNTASPLPYANSPRSGTNMMNAPSPQQQSQQQQHQQLQQQRQKLMQLPQHQQLLAQQQYRQSSMQGLQQLHGQHQMQFSQSLGHQQFQGRQLSTGHLQHGISQNQLNQGTQLNRHLNQFSGPGSSPLFNAAQGTPTSQMIANMSGAMSAPSLLPRMQYGLAGSNLQRSHASNILNDQMFNMGASNPGGMMSMQAQQQQPQQQQQQLGSQGAFGNMSSNAQGLQSNMVQLQNNPNFSQQRQQGQQ